MTQKRRLRRRSTGLAIILLAGPFDAFRCPSVTRRLSPPATSSGLGHQPVGCLFNQAGGDVDAMVDVVPTADSVDSSGIENPTDSLVGDLNDAGPNIEPRQTASSEEDISLSDIPFFARQASTKTIANPGNATSVEALSRRDWIAQSAFLLFGGALVAGISKHETPAPKPVTVLPRVINPVQTAAKPPVAKTGQLEPVNITKVATETNINVTMSCNDGCVSVDPKNFTKIKKAKVPRWLPSYLVPKTQVIKETSDAELLVAATIAGSITEMLRTSLLYPIQTVKTRVQTDVHNFTLRPPPMEERLETLGKNIRKHIDEGDLYAGIKPSLIVSVPATGVYYGVRDVGKRMLAMTSMSDTAIVLGAALLADVVSLCFRTPADALALRLQIKAYDDEVGDWFGDSWKRIPAVIITDLPYLLSKIFLNRQFIHGSISIDKYVEFAVFAAIVAAFLTTPFDVARTRILVDSDGDYGNGIDGGSGQGVLRTMIDISKEGRGGVANLFAGWLERVLYLGIGRAWLEPIQIIGYVGIRDAVLLEWF